MGKRSLISLARKKARKQRHTFGPLKVQGFLEPPPEIPPVKWHSKPSTSRVTSPGDTPSLPQISSQTEADHFCGSCAVGTQTDSPKTCDASTQTDGSADSMNSFLHGSLVSLRHNYDSLKENLFPSSITLSLPFLLPYQLMCIVVLNIRFALHSLFSQNTNLRRQFLRVLCTGIDKKILAPILGFSQKTFQRALQPRSSSLKPTLIGLRIPKKKRKSRIHPSVVADARKILDVLAPVKSGKIFRIVSCPLNYLYEQYRALASQISHSKPLSYHYFIGKILDIHNNYVHFENNPDFCPLCRELDEIETIHPGQQTAAQRQRVLVLQEHQRIAKIQWEEYHKIMKSLLTHPSHRLVIQDFNQQHANTSLQTRVLSIVVYGAPSGNLERHYYNYFLPMNQSNNLTAVIACHRNFFFAGDSSFISTASHFDIFNDGGPKHFKLTGYLALMSAIFAALSLQSKSLTQHYFASYHGSGPADAVASHMRRKIRNIRANYRHNPKSVQEMAQLCTEIANTDKSLAIAIPPELLQEEMNVHVQTFTGIKSYHKATFASNQTVSLWIDSSSTEPTLTKALGIVVGDISIIAIYRLSTIIDSNDR
jgi:predicted metal-dependent hydrolase